MTLDCTDCMTLGEVSIRIDNNSIAGKLSTHPKELIINKKVADEICFRGAICELELRDGK
jgi:hypothetical protein